MKFVLVMIFVVQNILLNGQETDEQLIRQVLDNETMAFSKQSLAAVAKKYWIIDSNTVRCISFLDGSTYILRGPDFEFLDEDPPAQHAVFRRYDYRVYINGNFAFVTNDQEVTLEGEQPQQYTHELWALEKIDGLWKIHLQTVHHFHFAK